MRQRPEKEEFSNGELNREIENVLLATGSVGTRYLALYIYDPVCNPPKY